MKQLAGTPNPRSWKETKLTTYPRVSLARSGHPLRLRVTGEETEQTIGDEGLQIVHHDGGERPRIARRNDGHLVSHRRTKGVEAEGTRCAVFFSLAISLRLRKPKQKASANGRVKNHRRPLFRVYKGPGEIHSKLRPNPPRNSNSKAKRLFLERLAHAQRPPHGSSVPSH
jgi:hypothetical protein